MIFGHRPKTLDKLGEAKKREYPGEYDDLTDLELGRMFQQENPGKYEDYREPSPRKHVQRETAITNIIGATGRGLGLGAEATARGVLAPALKPFAGPESAKRIQALQDRPEQVLPSDVLQQVWPSVFSPGGIEDEKDVPKEGIPFSWKEAGRTGARLGADIGFDPVSYATFGGSTLVGKTAQAAHATIKSGKPIALASKLARNMAKAVGESKASAKAIQMFKQKYLMEKVAGKWVYKGPAQGLTKGIASKQKALASFKLPFLDQLDITGEAASKITAPLSGLRRGQQGAAIEKGIRQLLSTKTGNADYDVLFSKMKDLAFHEEGIVLQEGKHLNQQLDDLSRELGKPKEVIQQEITALVEATKKLPKHTYSTEIRNIIHGSLKDKMVDAQVALAKARKTGATPEQIDVLAKQVANYNSDINILTGKYNPLPASDPKLAQMAKNISQRQHAQILDEIAGGVRVKPLLADIEYISHILTPEARKRLTEIAKAEGKLPNKLSQKEMSNFLANSIRREFAEVNPRIVDSWVDAGIITKKQALKLKSTIPSKGKALRGLDAMDDLLKDGTITEQQFTHGVHTLNIEEVNALGQQGKIRSFGSEPLKAIFHNDPAFATTVRGMRGARARIGAEFFNEMKARGLALPENAPEAANWVKVKPTELQGFKVAPEIAEHLNRYHNIVTNPTELKKFMGAFDHYNGLMKAWTLGIFPGYHTMNMVGNFWNNFLAGVVNPKAYIDALRVSSKAGGNVKITDIYGHTWNSKELLETAKKLGIVDRGWFHTDAATTVERELGKKGFKAKDLLDPTGYITPSSRNYFLRAGLKTGQGIENNARMAHFIDRLRKGDTAEEAAMSVKKYLFDYNDLSNVERQVANRLFWFYTWSRKNLPLQLQSLVHNPGKFSIPYKLQYEVNKNTPISPGREKYVQDYFKENFPLRIRYNKEKKEYTYFLLNKWLPATDIFKVAHIHDVALNMLHPLPKELIQQLWQHKDKLKGGIDFFTKEPIERVPGEKGRFLGMTLPKRVIHGAKIIRLLNEVDKMTKEDSDLFDKTISLLTGKTQKYNPTEQFIYNAKETDEGVSEIVKAIYRQELSGHPDKKETKRLMQMLNEQLGEY